MPKTFLSVGLNMAALHYKNTSKPDRMHHQVALQEFVLVKFL